VIARAFPGYPTCGLAEPDCHDLVAALRDLLDELHQVVTTLSPEQYARAGEHGGGVGGHVRHSLDHVKTLLASAERECLDYDARARDAAIESDRRAALDLLASLRDRLGALAGLDPQRTLLLATLPASHMTSVTVTTTLGRELAYVISHTIHHNAILALTVRRLGVEPPEHFGWAPSTMRHREQTACAR
jgi:uncharacterized damage-inducible protein DinB